MRSAHLVQLGRRAASSLTLSVRRSLLQRYSTSTTHQQQHSSVGALSSLRRGVGVSSVLTPTKATPPSWNTPRHQPFQCFSTAVDALVDGDDRGDDEGAAGQFESVEIYFASQTGTAQLFGQDLHQALEEQADFTDIQVRPMHEFDAAAVSPEKLYLFLVSTTGVGEPPGHAAAVYNELTAAAPVTHFGVFGLGNQKAHPNHYNTVAKTLNAALELTGKPVLPLTLGDDGDCIEDDFDQWVAQLVTVLKQDDAESSNSDAEASVCAIPAPSTADVSTDETAKIICSGKYPTIQLQEPATAVRRSNLLDACPELYQDGSRLYPVQANKHLSHDPVMDGLCEMQIDVTGQDYETGDHLVLYPRNTDAMVQAYVDVIDGAVSLDDIVQGPIATADENSSSSQVQYPHPTGISLHETLSHCVELEALPSPSFARRLTGKLDYKREIAHAQRTVLDLLLENGSKITLEDLLFQLAPMQPRYYSIASSAVVHPDSIYITYRPVHYLTSRGVMRQGVTTSFLRKLDAGDASVVASIRSNPSFRLPASTETSVWMVAGGCGVAPIRAFLEERLQMTDTKMLGPAWLFLGFRCQADQVYQDLVQEALDAGAITKSCLNFQLQLGATENESELPCGSVVEYGLVSDRVRRHGADFWEHCQAGGVTYLCGGARTFGVAIENEVRAIFEEHGGMTSEEATAYLQELIRTGRICEDLAD